jgi:uncharacterized coiled-coil protein SlyX
MSELSDYKQHVEAPAIRSYEATIKYNRDLVAELRETTAKQAAEIERLRALLDRAVTHLEDDQSHDEGAFDESCDTCLLLRDIRAALDIQQTAPEK